jgi:hypothetical protein
MNFSGILIGFFTLVAIGFGFFWVIKLEYYFGARIWKGVAGVGVLVSAASAFIPNPVLSAVVGILGGTVVWGAFELPDQEKRVAAGMFKKNPKRIATGKTS